MCVSDALGDLFSSALPYPEASAASVAGSGPRTHACPAGTQPAGHAVVEPGVSR